MKAGIKVKPLLAPPTHKNEVSTISTPQMASKLFYILCCRAPQDHNQQSKPITSSLSGSFTKAEGHNHWHISGLEHPLHPVEREAHSSSHTRFRVPAPPPWEWCDPTKPPLSHSLSHSLTHFAFIIYHQSAPHLILRSPHY